MRILWITNIQHRRKILNDACVLNKVNWRRITHLSGFPGIGDLAKNGGRWVGASGRRSVELVAVLAITTRPRIKVWLAVFLYGHVGLVGG